MTGPGPCKSTSDPKTVCYSPQKRPEMPEITSFYDATRVVYRRSQGFKNLPGTEKSWTIIHENGQKCLKSRVFYDFAKIVGRCPGPFKSTSDPKTVCYSPRKRPEMPEIASFYDTTRVVYRGSRGFEIFPGTKNRGL